MNPGVIDVQNSHKRPANLGMMDLRRGGGGVAWPHGIG